MTDNEFARANLITDLYRELDLPAWVMDYKGEIRQRGDAVRMTDGAVLPVDKLLHVTGDTRTRATAHWIAVKILDGCRKEDIEAFAAQVVEFEQDGFEFRGAIAYGIRFEGV